MKEIVVDVSDDGEVRIETRGFKGKACVSESQFLKDLLGRETAQALTPAYWEKEEVAMQEVPTPLRIETTAPVPQSSPKCCAHRGSFISCHQEKGGFGYGKPFREGMPGAVVV